MNTFQLQDQFNSLSIQDNEYPSTVSSQKMKTELFVSNLHQVKYQKSQSFYRQSSDDDSQQSTNSDQNIPFSKQQALQQSSFEEKNSQSGENLQVSQQNSSSEGVQIQQSQQFGDHSFIQSPIFLFGEDAQTWGNFNSFSSQQQQQQYMQQQIKKQQQLFNQTKNQQKVEDINDIINQQICNIIDDDEVNNNNTNTKQYFNNNTGLSNNDNYNNSMFNNTSNNFNNANQYQNQQFQQNSNTILLNSPSMIGQSSPQKQTQNYTNSKYVNCSQPSPTLFIRGFDINMLDMSLMHNIFSNFGNIKFIILIKSKQNVLMEFENEFHSTYAKDNLSGVFFAGGFLKIFYSNYLSIVERKAKDFNDEIYFEGNPSLYRFNQNQSQLPINPPSPIIFVDNISQQAFTQQTILQLFSQYGKIINYKLFSKNSRNMCLIKFTSYSESFQAFTLHKKMLLGRILNISFTKAKI